MQLGDDGAEAGSSSAGKRHQPAPSPGPTCTISANAATALFTSDDRLASLGRPKGGTSNDARSARRRSCAAERLFASSLARSPRRPRARIQRSRSRTVASASPPVCATVCPFYRVVQRDTGKCTIPVSHGSIGIGFSIATFLNLDLGALSGPAAGRWGTRRPAVSRGASRKLGRPRAGHAWRYDAPVT